MKKSDWRFGALLFFAATVLGINPAFANDEVVLLVCKGSLVTPAGADSNGAGIFSGISANIHADRLVIGGTIIFDGEYVTKSPQDDAINFYLTDKSGRLHRDIFVNLNRVTGNIVMMNVVWSRTDPTKIEKINTWIDGQCKKTSRVF